VSWGEQHGADARRLVAMLCRRGNVRGTDIGAIRVGATSSTVEVAASVAQGFAESTREPDPRDPRVLVTPFSGVPTREPQAERSEQRPRAHVPPSQHRAPRGADDERPAAAPRAFAPKPPVRDFAAKAPPRDFAPKPFVRDFAKGPPRDFAKGPPRAFAKGPPRDFAKGPPRSFEPTAPVRDEAPKRRKIVVTAPPTRRGPKKK
jgi:hypothetical protein